MLDADGCSDARLSGVASYESSVGSLLPCPLECGTLSAVA